MSNENLLLAENEKLFSPISVLHYEHYEDYSNLMKKLSENQDIQCIVGMDNVKFGQSQNPGLFSFADGVDTIQFLLSL